MPAAAGGNNITRNSIRLIGAAGAAQAFAFVLLPIVGRLYDKTEMGVLGTVLAIVNVAAVAGNGRYDQAVVLARREAADLLLVAAIAINLLFSFVLLLLLPFAGLIASTRSGYAEAAPYFIVIPPAVLLTGLTAAFTAMANNRKAYGCIGLSQIAQSLLNNGLKVGLGIARTGIAGLIAAALTGLAAGLAVLRPVRRLRAARRHISRRRIAVACRAYGKFPRYSLPQAGLDVLLGNLTALLLPVFYFMDNVGLIAMAAMVARRPLIVISDSYSRIYSRHFADLVSGRKRLYPAFRTYVFRSLLFGLPAAVLLFFLMPLLVTWVLGREWSGAVPLLRWMLPLLSINFLTATFNFLPDLLGRQRTHLFVQIAILFAELAAIVIPASLLPFEHFIACYYPASALILSAYFLWLRHLIHRYEHSLSRQ